MFAIKRKLKLNKKELALMAQHAGFSRFVYNYGLDLFWQSVNVDSVASDSKRLQAIKKCLTNVTKKRDEFAWMNNLSSKVYQSALQNLQIANARWRKGIGKAPVKKRRKDSCSFNVYDGNGPAVIKAGKTIKIPTMGVFRLHEAIVESYATQTFTISHQADGWDVSFAVNAEKIPPIIHNVAETTGIDLGVKTFATISDGTEIEATLPYKKAKTKLGMIQYRNRNKKLGNRKTGEKASNNARKYYRKLARFHKRIADKRKDFLHKTTTSICRKYAHIRIEDLNVCGMVANRKLSTSVSDLGFYEFRSQLEYKAPVYGTKLDIVDRWYPSSKQCRKCHHLHDKLKLSERVFVCPNCGHTESRDLHAAINLANAPDDKCSRVGSPRIYACGRQCYNGGKMSNALPHKWQPTALVEAGIVDRCQMMSSK